MAQLFSNNAYTTLASGCTAGDATLTVADGSKFPSPTGGDFFTLTLVGLDGNGNENLWEIVKCTARSGNTLTVTRGQEGTTAQVWPSATLCDLRATAGTLANSAKTDVKQTFTAQQTPMKGTLTDAATIDWNGDSHGQSVKLTTAAARTFNAPTNINEDALYVLRLTTGGFTPGWNTAYKWPSGGTPASLASGTYVFTFIGGAGNTLIPTGPGYLTGA